MIVHVEKHRVGDKVLNPCDGSGLPRAEWKPIDDVKEWHIHLKCGRKLTWTHLGSETTWDTLLLSCDDCKSWVIPICADRECGQRGLRLHAGASQSFKFGEDMLKIEIDGAPVGLVAQRVQVVESDDPAWLAGDWAWMMVCVDPLVGEFPCQGGARTHSGSKTSGFPPRGRNSG